MFVSFFGVCVLVRSFVCLLACALACLLVWIPVFRSPYPVQDSGNLFHHGEPQPLGGMIPLFLLLPLAPDFNVDRYKPDAGRRKNKHPDAPSKCQL